MEQRTDFMVAQEIARDIVVAWLGQRIPWDGNAEKIGQAIGTVYQQVLQAVQSHMSQQAPTGQSLFVETGGESGRRGL
jgi:hypothetical protein